MRRIVPGASPPCSPCSRAAASGVSVVNGDNRFGAAYNACLINRQAKPITPDKHSHPHGGA
ncbi:MAG: hypothetical protein R3C45_17900 [Phycisphaerales bacterium]